MRVDPSPPLSSTLEDLDEWYTEESWWPKNRGLKMFKQRFDIQCHSMIGDLSGETIGCEDAD